MTFDDLGLGPEILKAIAERGYTNPTPIQEKAIPIVLMGRDVMGLAQTGTGKTAGFTLPMIEILAGGRARARMPRSLILEPTRELAAQVADNFDIYGKYHNLSKALLVGGESMGDQQKILDKGVDVLIATPGRLIDLFERGSILLNDIRVLVIDEADRMLDMGFIPDIEEIVSRIPPLRQTLLFSATMPPEIQKLADKFLSNPRTVSVAPPASPAESVRQSLVWVEERQKRKALETLIRQEDLKNAFIFCNRKREVDELAKWLNQRGFSAAPMHGDMVQTARTRTLLDFKEGRLTLLVCSDVAARGLDIEAVSHVFNYDIPTHADDYIHRIGRTGRAGQKGTAWSIASPDDQKYVQAIERLSKREIPVVELAGFEKPDFDAEDSAPRGNRRSGRGGKKPAPKAEAPKVERPERKAQPERQERSERPERPARQERPERQDRQDRNGGDKGGAGDRFGDDLPAFLRR